MQDRIYVFQRQGSRRSSSSTATANISPVGQRRCHRSAWAENRRRSVYTTDRSDSVAKSFSLDGKLNTGSSAPRVNILIPARYQLARERAAGPFNHPTEMLAHPNGDIYITDGYRNARVHRFTRRKASSRPRGAHRAWRPGQFHLPHSIALRRLSGNLSSPTARTSASRSSSPDGEFLGHVDRHGRAERHHAAARTATTTLPSRKTTATRAICRPRPDGTVLVQLDSRHDHGIGVNSRGDIYAGLTQERSVDKFVP